jgi:hypothetical protein
MRELSVRSRFNNNNNKNKNNKMCKKNRGKCGTTKTSGSETNKPTLSEEMEKLRAD